jgi:AmmeMemoRadiSam system protein B
VQLPFLQTLLQNFELVPIVVGDSTPEEVADVLEKLWGGPETLILISSDLSHYHSYPKARSIDSKTADKIVKLKGPLGYQEACGAMAINGLLLVAQRKGLVPKLLDLRNSGDTAGKKNEVVGYGAFAFYEDPSRAAKA